MRRALLLAAAVAALPARAADQPTWAQPLSRNMVSAERNLPDTFDPATQKNVRWVAPLGTQTYSSPVVANGKVLIGTNNDDPKDPTKTWDAGVLMCLDEKSGQFVWQLVAPKLENDKYYDWPKTGLPSSASIDPAANRAYVMTNRVEFVCLDLNGLADGNQGPFTDEASAVMPRTADGQYSGKAPLNDKDADVIWSLDVRKACDTWPHDGANASPLFLGGHIYLNTCNGVDNTHRAIRKPDAPSLIVIDPQTGKLLAKDDEHIGPNIFHSTWCSPSLLEVNGQTQILFGGGNGILYGFAPLDPGAPADQVQTLKKLWSYDPDPTAPKSDVHKFTTNRKVSPSNIYAMPIAHGGKLYVIPTGDWWWGKKSSSLQCLDPAKLQSVTPADQSSGDAATASVKHPALLWTYPMAAHCMTTPAITDDGLIFLADSSRTLHCVDAATGQAVWTHKLLGEPWGSPVVADGKVYVGSRKGDFWILSAGRELKVLCQADLGSPVSSTVGIANGTVFIPTAKALWAIGAGR